MGPVNGLAQIIPRYISRRGGTVAIVSSLAGYRGLPTSSAYGATKAALINMCESLKIELENYNVKLILINPGFVKLKVPVLLVFAISKAIGNNSGNTVIEFGILHIYS